MLEVLIDLKCVQDWKVLKQISKQTKLNITSSDIEEVNKLSVWCGLIRWKSGSSTLKHSRERLLFLVLRIFIKRAYLALKTIFQKVLNLF